MFYKILIYILCLLFSLISTYAQDRKKEIAERAFKNFSFLKAARHYQDLVDRGYSSKEIYKNLGDSYYYIARYKEAADCYGHLFNDSLPKMPAEYYLRYTQSLNHLGEYQRAEKIIKMYYGAEWRPDNNEDWNAEKIKQRKSRYTIKPLELNTISSEYGTAFYGKEKILYTSSKDSGCIMKRKDSWNEKPFFKLYQADISSTGELRNSRALKGDVNTRMHQSSAAITKDGKTMYFTRSNFLNGKQKAGKKGTTHLKIYAAQNVNGNWTNIKELDFPINSDGFSSAHPALSPDETELYFVSDRSNSFGNSDLYKVSRKPDGFIGNDVTRLSDEINTPGRETYPFVSEQGVLFFSSDGHPGLGGLDIHAAVKDQYGRYHVVNAGTQINSADDDFAYIINADKKGYFSSNRSGSDDIYAFTENEPVDFGFTIDPIIFGTLKNEKDGKPIADCTIEVYDDTNKKYAVFHSDNQGRYTVLLEPFKHFTLKYSKEGMAGQTHRTAPLKPVEKKELSFDFLLEMEVETQNSKQTVKLGDDLGQKLNLGKVYFDYNGQKIRKSSKAVLDKIIEFLKERPNISIKINSYTDSRGNDDFNLKLSGSRAKATVEYLVQNGISPDRLSSEGFGETQLLNHCDNGENCTEQEHKINRRSEFIIVGIERESK